MNRKLYEIICFAVIFLYALHYYPSNSQQFINRDKLLINQIWVPPTCIRSVQNGDYVRYHYYGILSSGKYFDSSYERGVSYGTYVGSGWLIEGLDIGLIGMCINEHRLITVPSQLGYGLEEAGDGDIPANSTLLFNVVLLDIWNDDDYIQVKRLFVPSLCERQIEASDYIRYHYNGTLLNGAKFHSSYDEEQTYNTYVGLGWLIKGMDEGLIGACQGERRQIVIPPHMAYGERGDSKNIPPSSTIVFDVEIVDFHNPKDDVVVKITKSIEKCERKLISTDFVRYHYNGTLADGSLFDSSYKRNHTYDTYVGYRRIIPGMEKGLLGSCMGEWRSITLPPHLGYGERGVDGIIPGSAVLTFYVHIIDFHNPTDDVQIEILQKPDNCNSDDVVKAKKGDYLTYDYVLKLMDGTEVESSLGHTYTPGSYLGKGSLIPGVESGLLGMCVGETRRLVIPPHIGYGEFGKDNFIPGSAVLDFTFTLHNIEEPLPDGYIFLWLDHPSSSENVVFNMIDEDKKGTISLHEFASFIFEQVDKSHARLIPGIPREQLIVDIFKSKDKNGDDVLDVNEWGKGLESENNNKVVDEL